LTAIFFYASVEVPSYLVLLAYVKLSRVSADVIIDDEKDLPKGF